VTRSTRALGWAYLLAALLTAHCATNAARNGAPWHAAGLVAVSLLLGVAREYVASDERRAAAVRAERAARLRTWASHARTDLEDGCCERWWTSCGTEHDDLPHCTRKDQAA
jgi:hypothetical protein